MAGIKVVFRFGEIIDLANNLPKVVPAVENEIDDIGLRMAERGARMVRQRMRKSSGKGQRSINVRVQRRQFTFGSDLIHVRVMDQGRRAGAKMPPRGSLVPWMKRHGIPEREEFPIRRAIGRRGIKGDFVFKQVRDELKPIVAAELGSVRAEVFAALVGSKKRSRR